MFATNVPNRYAPTPVVPSTGSIDVLLGILQSNAGEKALKSDLPTSPVNLQAPQPGCLLAYRNFANTADALAGSPTLAESPWQDAAPAGSFHGYEITLARNAIVNGKNLAILKWSAGGSSMADAFIAKGLYRLAKAYFDEQLALLASNFGAYNVKGVALLGGETDGATLSYARETQDSLATLVNQLRADYGPQLRAGVYELHSGDDTGVIPYLTTVRSGQVAWVGADANAFITNIDDQPAPPDGLHPASAAMQVAGDRFYAGFYP